MTTLTETSSSTITAVQFALRKETPEVGGGWKVGGQDESVQAVELKVHTRNTVQVRRVHLGGLSRSL